MKAKIKKRIAKMIYNLVEFIVGPKEQVPPPAEIPPQPIPQPMVNKEDK